MRHYMIHPFFCYLGIGISFAISFALYTKGGIDDWKYFYLPIVLLIGYYTLYAVVTDRERYQKRGWWQSAVNATGKYLFWGLILLAIIALYRLHPLYQALAPNTARFFVHLMYAFAVFGWPYFFLADRYRSSPGNTLRDHYLTVGVLVRCLAKLRWNRFKRRLASRQTRRMLVSAALRVHFIPVMFEQVYIGVTSLMMQARAPAEQVFFGVSDFTLQAHYYPHPVLLMLTTLAWMVDSNNASIGYFWESRFTKTYFREVDPHPSHWVVTLACYVPFIYFVNANLAEFPSLPEDSPRVFASASVNTAIEITMVVMLLLYMASGSALAFSFSNLSYKRIQTRGPYRFVRHPSITFKIIFFTLAFYRFAPAYTLGWLLCYLTWMGIYICRAFVEERFLRRFPDYREYMQQTRYRFIPGVL